MSFALSELTLFVGKNMIDSLLGIKQNMTSTYDSRGRRVGATVVQISPNLITQVKTADAKDGYDAVQLGYGTKRSVKKPQLGHGKKAGIETPIRWFKEVKSGEKGEDSLKPGTAITLNQVFSVGDSVKVTAKSKGKGFQGGVRRHGFHGGPKTHGQSDRLRAPGAIGSGTTPGRVYKGKKMAGHMGDNQVSTKNLEVVGLEKDKNLLFIKGAVPGAVGGLVMITKLGRVKGYTPPPEEKPEEEEEVSEDGQGKSDESQKEESGSKEEKPEAQEVVGENKEVVENAS